MVLILNSNVSEQAPEYKQLMAHLAGLPGIQSRVHVERGSEKTPDGNLSDRQHSGAENRGHAESALCRTRGAGFRRVPYLGSDKVPGSN
jgi:hypothetical protein